MSINIFGATNKNNTSVHGVREQPGIGFKFLNDEGNFDIDNKRLADLSEPIDNNDATTTVYVNKRVARLKNALVRVINTNKSKFEDSINKINENVTNSEILSGKVIEKVIEN